MPLMVSAGWWFVSTEEIEGWAPSSYLETLSGVDEQNYMPNQGSYVKCHLPCTLLPQTNVVN